MKITIADKLGLILLIYKQIGKLPLKFIPQVLFKPADATRYDEFLYLLKYIKANKIYFNKVLDVSSPFILSYILSENASVLKTDINPAESHYIKPSSNLKFELTDGTRLPYQDNSFDLVYSISVVEHIHPGYLLAMNEMIRVCKSGGLLYITFPLSKNYTEEWIENSIYSNQHTSEGRTFFQYRFDKIHYEKILAGLKGISILQESIYWENKDGQYDAMVKDIRSKWPLFLNPLKNVFLHFYYGFAMLQSKPTDFINEKSFGNVSLILKKI